MTSSTVAGARLPRRSVGAYAARAGRARAFGLFTPRARADGPPAPRHRPEFENLE
jgi:hypothetical protein